MKRRGRTPAVSVHNVTRRHPARLTTLVRAHLSQLRRQFATLRGRIIDEFTSGEFAVNSNPDQPRDDHGRFVGMGINDALKEGFLFHGMSDTKFKEFMKSEGFEGGGFSSTPQKLYGPRYLAIRQQDLPKPSYSQGGAAKTNVQYTLDKPHPNLIPLRSDEEAAKWGAVYTLPHHHIYEADEHGTILRRLGTPPTTNEFNPAQPRDATGKWAAGVGAVKAVLKRATDLSPSWLKVTGGLAAKASMALIIAGNKAVTAVAKERGLTDAQVARVSKVVACVDVAMGGWRGAGAATALGLGALAVPAAVVPLGSLSYLAYSTARNPMATYRAARKAVIGAVGAARELASLVVPSERPLYNAGTSLTDDEARLVAMAVIDHRYDAWYEALLFAALDRHQDVRAAVAVAGRAAHGPTLSSSERHGGRAVANYDPAQIVNAFCPTGPGGGQDNSCGSGDSQDHHERFQRLLDPSHTHTEEVVAKMRPDYTPSQSQALKDYAYGESFKAVNGPLREGRPLSAEATSTVKHLDSAMMQTPEPITLVRGVPKKVYEAFASGQYTKDAGYSSSTTSEASIPLMSRGALGLVLAMHLRPGTNIAVPKDRYEREVVIGRNLNYRIIGERTFKTGDKERRVLHVEVWHDDATTNAAEDQLRDAAGRWTKGATGHEHSSGYTLRPVKDEHGARWAIHAPDGSHLRTVKKLDVAKSLAEDAASGAGATLSSSEKGRDAPGHGAAVRASILREIAGADRHLGVDLRDLHGRLEREHGAMPVEEMHRHVLDLRHEGKLSTEQVTRHESGLLHSPFTIKVGMPDKWGQHNDQIGYVKPVRNAYDPDQPRDEAGRWHLVSAHVTDSKSLTPSQRDDLANHILASITRKPRLERVVTSDPNHSSGDVVTIRPTSFTDKKLSEGKGAEHISVKYSDQAIYVVDSPKRGLDVDYSKVSSTNFSAAGERETILAGRYSVESVNRVDHPARNGTIKVYHLKEIPTRNSLTENWIASTSPERLNEFQRWLRTQLDSTLTGKSQEQMWTQYIRRGWLQGAGRAFDDTNKARPKVTPEDQVFYQGGRQQFLRDAFNQPVARERVDLLASRTFDEMEDVSRDVANRMSRALVDGLIGGSSSQEITSALVEATEFGRGRAEKVARTEIMRAHAEGQLDGFQQMGVQELGVLAELSTSGLGNVCEECAALAGETYTIEEARGLIPVHPQCECVWVPNTEGA